MLYDINPVIVEITQAQYNSLSEADKMNGTIYFITDSPSPSGGGLNSVDVNVQSAEYTVPT